MYSQTYIIECLHPRDTEPRTRKSVCHGLNYGNPKIKIPLPGSVQKAEKLVRMAGYGSQVEAFDLSMNQSAEKAVPEDKNIFWDSIKLRSITHARKILDGDKNEATLYFQEKTSERLSEIFKPIVHKSMSEVRVTEKYQEFFPLIETSSH
jgi:hypothetical protein